MAFLNHSVSRQDDRSGQAFLQLANVERPAVEQQGSRSLGTERDLLRSVFEVSPQQHPDEQAQILAPFAQRRQGKRQPGNPGQQIGSKAIVGDERFQIAMSGGEQADVHFQRPRSSDREYLTLLQHSQEHRLSWSREVADLVEEERSMVCTAN